MTIEFKHDPGIAERAALLLGGRSVLGQTVRSALDAHEVIVAGLPGAALHRLVGSLRRLDLDVSLTAAFGLSRRTYQRSQEKPERRLSAEQGGRAWKFAEILALATDVLGSQEEAERWLDTPAMALDQRRPLELLSSPTGTELVETLLKRIEYGVYT